jgi:hypothetical protein
MGGVGAPIAEVTPYKKVKISIFDLFFFFFLKDPIRRDMTPPDNQGWVKYSIPHRSQTPPVMVG